MAKTQSKNTPATASNGTNGQHGAPEADVSLNVKKTYKLYIGGKFPRTESGRYYGLNSPDGELLANVCRGSRKDFRNSVVAARKAFGGWSSRPAFNRGQVLYRIGEMLEGRKAQFVAELIEMGVAPEAAKAEVRASVDRLVYYAGWCDKYQQVFSSVNPVASSHFNFSMFEPTGVVSAFAPEDNGLLGLVSVVAPIIAGGNTCVVLAAAKLPLCAITFAEVLNSSDVPGGVVNILTGYRDELLEHFSTHMDVNAMVYTGGDKKDITEIQKNATGNVKRAVVWGDLDWSGDKAQGPYKILALQETKTTWHPVGI